MLTTLVLVDPAIAGTVKVEWPTVRQLPTTESIEKVGSGGFRINRATRNDLDHQSTNGIPAWWVTESISGMGWDTGAGFPTPPPAFLVHAPAVFRNQVAMFNGTTGWLAVPRGWHVKFAVIAMAGGGNSIIFVAPDGASHGWMSYYWAGAGVGENLGAADGLFPGAHRRDDEFIGARTPKEVLRPKPTSFKNPDRCTALVTYRSGGLVVKGLALSYWVDAGEPGFVSLFVALPAEEGALQDFLVAAFKPPPPQPPAFCPPAGYYRQHRKQL